MTRVLERLEEIVEREERPPVEPFELSFAEERV
jgi:hypothetical protein